MLKSGYQNLSSYWNVWLSNILITKCSQCVTAGLFFLSSSKHYGLLWCTFCYFHVPEMCKCTYIYMGKELKYRPGLKSEKGTAINTVFTWVCHIFSSQEFKNMSNLKVDWSFLHGENILSKQIPLWPKRIKNPFQVPGTQTKHSNLAYKRVPKPSVCHWFSL